MATTTLILGGGFGGIRTATTLRGLLPKDHRIVLIDRTAMFTFGLAKTWLALDMAELKGIVHSLVPLAARGIEVVKANITAIDAMAKRVTTDRGEFSGDFLVIALGADCNMGLVPGLERAAETFYTLEGAITLKRTLAAFSGGELVLLIPKTPFKCPPGPYEGMFLIHDFLKKKGVLSRSKLSVFTVEGAPMATAGPEIGKFMVDELKARGIAFNNLKQTSSVDPEARQIKFADGSSAPFDLLIAVPPHEAPKVVKESGLTNAGGWIPADPKTSRVAAYEGVFAIGDVAVVSLPGQFKPETPLVLPKAGVFADAQGKVVARQIMAAVTGKPTDAAFDGKGFCYIETGDMHAVKGEGSFFEMPNPVMARRVPDMQQFQEKRAWVEGWLRENLG